MRNGCDPVDLEAVALRCAAVARRIRATRALLAAVDERAWTGRVARRSWAALDELGPQLGGAAVSLDLQSRRLRAHADAQRRASLPTPDRSVVRVDTVGDGRWVTRTGAADADVVVVLVPGVGTDVSDRAELDRDARRVWERLAVASGEVRVAVVSWLGYDPPDRVVEGWLRGPATVGGADLAADVATWRRGGATRVVVVGHSYGALVASSAAAAGMRPDELVLLGAPGLGVHEVADLHLGPGAGLWAGAADGDAVSLLARAGWVHGPDPLGVAARLPTSLAGHGRYLDDPVLLHALVELALHDTRPTGTVAPIAPPTRAT